jgi:hypothetical protein
MRSPHSKGSVPSFRPRSSRRRLSRWLWRCARIPGTQRGQRLTIWERSCSEVGISAVQLGPTKLQKRISRSLSPVSPPAQWLGMRRGRCHPDAKAVAMREIPRSACRTMSIESHRPFDRARWRDGRITTSNDPIFCSGIDDCSHGWRLRGRCSRVEHTEAEFIAGRGWRRTESGTLWLAKGGLKKPGKMRWEYRSPREKLFVSDGRDAWFYVPGDRQVRKRKRESWTIFDRRWRSCWVRASWKRSCRGCRWLRMLPRWLLEM